MGHTSHVVVVSGPDAGCKGPVQRDKRPEVISPGVLAEISGGDPDKVYLLSEREPYRRRIETSERQRSFRRKLAITFESKREA
jgi:hypothetical protein